MLPTHERATCLESGLFGFANIKLGANGKEHGIILRNVRGFRRVLLAGVVLLILALSCVCLYWRRASYARTELAEKRTELDTTKCRGTVESILLKQEEIDELCKRLRQRQTVDKFLASERTAELQLKARLSVVARSGSESKERQDELDTALMKELEVFTESVGDAVTDIIGPLDQAFKDIPITVRVLQADIATQLPAFERLGPNSKAGDCADLPTAIAGAPWEHTFNARIGRLVDLGRNATHETTLDQSMMAEWVRNRNPQQQEPKVPAALVAMLFKWYTAASPDDLANVLLSMDPVLREKPTWVSPVDPEEDDDDDNKDSPDTDDDDDDNNTADTPDTPDADDNAASVDAASAET